MSVSASQVVPAVAVQIGRRIRLSREAKKLSQRQLAQRCDLNPTTIWRYESGTMQPGTNRLSLIARVLAVTTDYLITGKRPKK